MPWVRQLRLSGLLLVLSLHSIWRFMSDCGLLVTRHLPNHDRCSRQAVTLAGQRQERASRLSLGNGRVLGRGLVEELIVELW